MIRRQALRLKGKVFEQALKAADDASMLSGFCKFITERILGHRILPLVWMDQSEPHERGVLRPGKEVTIYGPDVIGQGQKNTRLQLPDVAYFRFLNGRVSARSSSVISRDNTALVERFRAPEQASFEYASGQIAKHSSSSAVVTPDKSEVLERGIFLGGNGSENYYHWIVEVLTRTEFIEKLPVQFSDFPLLVGAECMAWPSFRESLAIYGGNRQLVVLNEATPYTVKDLVYITSPNNIPFNLTRGSRFQLHHFATDGQSMRYLRDRALAACKPAISDQRPGKLIFLARRNTRRAYNEEQVFGILQPYGFKKVYFENLSFADQVRTAHAAEVLAGPTGAAWTNLLFCRPGAKALCWMACENGEFAAYSTIAHEAGVNMKFLQYEAGFETTEELYSHRYQIDETRIYEGLQALQIGVSE
ncbi:MAG: glycosyltransferase family 61 protein [Gammaproteobacteria bacterium]|nr:glycosyltransferase family 61 protein [Gammaproteobacteria bacterium]